MAERRGDDDQVAGLFAVDAGGLIDDMIALDLISGACAFFTDATDHRFDAEIVLTLEF